MSAGDEDDVKPASDRRGGQRHFACFPTSLNRPDGKKRTAMIHDLSVSGGLLIVRTALAVGDRISLEFYFNGDPEAPTRITPGRVIRVTPLEPSEIGPWTHKVAVRFDERLDDFEGEIRALAERQKHLGFGA